MVTVKAVPIAAEAPRGCHGAVSLESMPPKLYSPEQRIVAPVNTWDRKHLRAWKSAWAAALFLSPLLGTFGCSRPAPPSVVAAAPRNSASAAAPTAAQPGGTGSNRTAVAPSATDGNSQGTLAASAPEGGGNEQGADVPGTPKKPPEISGRPLPNPLEDLLQRGAWPPYRPSAAPPRKIDEANAAAAGIRKLTGEHLTLFTDLPSSEAVDGLPRLFDLACPLWRQYFQVPQARVDGWRVNAFLMRDRELFKQAGLWRHDLPDFPNGFTYGHELWLMDQPSDYYRRHLLLHEGTHSFMYCLIGGDGPPWYIEGMAELLGTHALREGALVFPHFPQNREEVPQWGRIKLLKEAFQRKEALYFPDVLEMPYRSENENYAFWWAAAAFLDGHPRYQERFRNVRVLLPEPRTFAEKFQAAFASDWRDLCEEWQVFLSNLDYGYDVVRGAVAFRDGQELPEAGVTVAIAADKTWQSSGVRLRAGQKYRITASGRYVVRKAPKEWVCEPQGISIDYYQGLPLGALLGALRADDQEPKSPSKFLAAELVGRELLATPQYNGTLYLRINEFPGALADNEGTLQVKVEKVPVP